MSLLRPAAIAAALAVTGCSIHVLEKLAMEGAYRPAAGWRSTVRSPDPRYRILAGDMHCHVSPPDDAVDVSRDAAETIALARAEDLDFVFLTPHLPPRFYADPALRAEAVAGQAAMRRAFAGEKRTVFASGFEYTDPAHGHFGATFADLERVLAEVPVEVAQRDPGRFFDRWVADGGLLVVNHPLVTPVDTILPATREDMSFRPWTSPAPVPPEIDAIRRLAHGFEVYNAAVSHLRDRLLLDDAAWGVREGLRRLDLEIAGAHRRIAPAGGSDSHTGFLRATMFVLAEARTEAAVRDAIVGGRVCVRSPEACTLEARAPGGPWVGVGGALRSGGVVEVRASGDPIVVYRDGTAAAMPRSGEGVALEVPAGRCTLVRAHVGEGDSAPIYVNCGFAEAGDEARETRVW